MPTRESRIVAGELHSPAPVTDADAEVIGFDLGVAGSIILTVKREGEVFYETYELVRVEAEADLRGE